MMIRQNSCQSKNRLLIKVKLALKTAKVWFILKNIPTFADYQTKTFQNYERDSFKNKRLGEASHLRTAAEVQVCDKTGKIYQKQKAGNNAKQKQEIKNSHEKNTSQKQEAGDNSEQIQIG